MQLRSPRAAAAALLVALLAACNQGGDKVLDPPRLPIDVRDELLIADGYVRSRPATTLTLVCAQPHQLHLLERTRLPEPHDDLKVPWTYHATMIVGEDLGRKLTLDAELIALGELDTILSHPLSPDQVDRLALIFGTDRPKRVYFGGISESGVFLTGKVRGSDIQAFTSKCA